MQDSGKYTLHIKNQYGSDEVSVNLTVLEKPSAPRGPLEVTNVTANGCTLTWKATISEVDGYSIEMLCPDTQKWKQIGKVDESTTTHTTKKLSEGKTFSFRIYATSLSFGSSKPLESNQPITTKNPFRKSQRNDFLPRNISMGK